MFQVVCGSLQYVYATFSEAYDSAQSLLYSPWTIYHWTNGEKNVVLTSNDYFYGSTYHNAN